MSPVSIDQARQLLATHGQSHVLQFWERLDSTQRAGLLHQVAQLDFASLARMRSMLKERVSTQDLSGIRPAPVSTLDAGARQQAHAMGEKILRTGGVGVILVAGGQGSRLGFDGPKGAFSVGPVSGASLFAIHARKIHALERRYGAPVPLYIMTSESNDADTRAFFARHKYFGLTADRVHFFVQGMWPALSEDGQIILDRPDHIFMSPDGHGGTVSALQASGMLDNMAARGLRVLYYFQVDNPMVDVADPVFLGFHSMHHADISLKVCAKRDPEEKLGVVVEMQGRYAMVEYTELTPSQKHARTPDGELLFRHGSVAIHAFDFGFLQRQAAVDLPLHLAHKKVAMCTADGVTVTPAKPNAYKFEKFIFDLLPNSERVFNLEFAREDEFSPVKNGEGEDSPATAQRDLSRKFARWLAEAGVSVPRNAAGDPLYRIEIDPVFAMSADVLKGKISPQLAITGDLLLA
ncbi:MAG: UDPGP type 1 family protein [Lentisphaerae bacterium]|nr:UDPGP type 1 family protein [Lentisphaerota bacterium]